MPFQKGSSGNPNGGKRPRMVTQQIIASLNETVGKGPTKLRMLVDALIAKALDGDSAAIREVIDRVEGKPAQMVTADAETFRRAVEMSDDELASIAAGSGANADPAPVDTSQLN